jgi:hypothetical protein
LADTTGEGYFFYRPGAGKVLKLIAVKKEMGFLYMLGEIRRELEGIAERLDELRVSL